MSPSPSSPSGADRTDGVEDDGLASSAPGADAAGGGVALAAGGLQKHFRKGGRELRILDGIDLTLAAGASVAVMGASGAGKSTLLHVLGGLERPTAGQVRLDGEDMYTLSDAARATLRNRCLGFVFQFHHLLREFTALENVMMPALVARRPRAEAAAQAASLLEAVGLSDRATHRPGELSGGEQQRVAIARALVRSPGVVLADEPTGNLDVETGARVFETLLEVNRSRGTTLLVVTHNPELAGRLDRVLRMVGGRLREEAP